MPAKPVVLPAPRAGDPHDAHAIDETLFSRLKKHYDEGEIVEISAMAGMFNYFNRVNDALHTEPTKPGEGL